MNRITVGTVSGEPFSRALHFIGYIGLVAVALSQAIIETMCRTVNSNDTSSHDLKKQRRLLEQGVISGNRNAREKQRILYLHR